MNISENGKTVADYDYTVDGQLAKSNVSGKEESFVWDDLALIQRNNTELTNEPYVTGGNPIMANDKALFNDMLGSTLGVAANGSYTPINRTSFGEVDNASSGEYNFFTGKPNVEGLGYSFLFRNYNANNGKWLSQDPLGYPDGWNNTAYINNQTIDKIDMLGLATITGTVSIPVGTPTYSEWSEWTVVGYQIPGIPTTYSRWRLVTTTYDKYSYTAEVDDGSVVPNEGSYIGLILAVAGVTKLAKVAPGSLGWGGLVIALADAAISTWPPNLISLNISSIPIPNSRYTDSRFETQTKVVE